MARPLPSPELSAAIARRHRWWASVDPARQEAVLGFLEALGVTAATDPLAGVPLLAAAAERQAWPVAATAVLTSRLFTTNPAEASRLARALEFGRARRPRGRR